MNRLKSLGVASTGFIRRKESIYSFNAFNATSAVASYGRSCVLLYMIAK